MSDLGPAEACLTFSYEAEMSALGSMMLSDRAAMQVAEMLTIDDFFRPAHRTIFKIFLDLLQFGPDLDFIRVKDALFLGQHLDDIGGENYLLEIAEYVPSPSNSGYYAELVKHHAVRRRSEAAGEKHAFLSRNGASPSELAEHAAHMQNIAMVAGRAPVTALADITIDHDIPRGLLTGFKSLDNLGNTGGVPVGQMALICGKSGGGKSTLAESIALNMALDGKRVLYALFADLKDQEFKIRAIQMLSGLAERPAPKSRFVESYEAAEREIQWSADMDVFDASKGQYTLERFFAWLGEAQRRKRYDTVFMDYAQVFTLDARSQSTVDLQFQSAVLCSRKAKELDIPLWVLSQLTEDRTSYSQQWTKEAAWDLRIQKDGVKCFKGRFGGADVLMPITHDALYAKYIDQS
jgi:replicative DNA helicase